MKIKFIISIFILLLVLPRVVQAISLGVVQKRNSIEVDPGDTVQFIILFWNRGNFSYPVEIEKKQAPEEWIVLVRPSDFILSQSKKGPPYDDGEYIGLPGIGDLKTEPVKVYVNIPDSAEPGEYQVVVNVKAGNPTEGVSVLMEKNLKFTVKVKGPISEESKSVETTILDKDTIDKVTGKSLVTEKKENNLFFIVVIVLVVFFFWLIRRLF